MVRRRVPQHEPARGRGHGNVRREPPERGVAAEALREAAGRRRWIRRLRGRRAFPPVDGPEVDGVRRLHGRRGERNIGFVVVAIARQAHGVPSVEMSLARLGVLPVVEPDVVARHRHSGRGGYGIESHPGGGAVDGTAICRPHLGHRDAAPGITRTVRRPLEGDLAAHPVRLSGRAAGSGHRIPRPSALPRAPYQRQCEEGRVDGAHGAASCRPCRYWDRPSRAIRHRLRRAE
mmetsp:Transcript_43870/g.133602  ORF Transcript_43870/g.133602 Transcript_43870/m.133602 type:complete len:233 (+) Transcript_43870:795-1493(+)